MLNPQFAEREIYLRNTETLSDIPYADYPELKLNKNETTLMPFRYVKGGDGQPVMPEVGGRLEVSSYRAWC